MIPFKQFCENATDYTVRPLILEIYLMREVGQKKTILDASWHHTELSGVLAGYVNRYTSESPTRLVVDVKEAAPAINLAGACSIIDGWETSEDSVPTLESADLRKWVYTAVEKFGPHPSLAPFAANGRWPSVDAYYKHLLEYINKPTATHFYSRLIYASPAYFRHPDSPQVIGVSLFFDMDVCPLNFTAVKANGKRARETVIQPAMPMASRFPKKGVR